MLYYWLQTPERHGTVTEQRTSDLDYMRQALRLARRGLGFTSPNPMVGAVIVKDGRVIATGCHHYFGGDHAEVDALKHATEDVVGATMYVTLEPCHHYGKTPPCVDALIAHKLGRVVIGMLDPDPRTAGKSVKKLRENGIETTIGLLENQCVALNEAYIRHRTTGRPLVTIKFAQGLDGRLAAASGNSQWITSEASRKLAHRLRARNDAILIGVQTVLSDDPSLTVRHVKGRNPLRVVLDATLRTPATANLITDGAARTLIATTAAADSAKAEAFRNKGIDVVTLPVDDRGWVDIEALLDELGRREITSLLVEGGAGAITSFVKLGLADRFVAFIAPRLIGKGIETIGELGVKAIADAVALKFEKVAWSSVDLIIEGRFAKNGD